MIVNSAVFGQVYNSQKCFKISYKAKPSRNYSKILSIRFFLLIVSSQIPLSLALKASQTTLLSSLLLTSLYDPFNLMFVGQFSPALFFKLASINLAITITVIYFIAQHLKQQPPLSWISSCAQHYPEFILFRIATITGAVFVLLGWMTNTFYLRTVAKENGFHIQKYQPQIPMILGIMGALFLTVSTATLDTGERKGKLHVHCASGFFICTFFGILYNTILSCVTQYKTKALNQIWLGLKIIVAGFLVAMEIYNSINKSQAIGSKKGVILEWAASYTVAAYFYLMSKDVEHLRYEYEEISTTLQP